MTPPASEPPPVQPTAGTAPVIEIDDARILRGLAHPVRLALIGLLRREGPLTATEAGARIGESPASCSFHLRQLARYGLVVEAGGGRGRRRPWRATARSTSWSPAPADPERAAAAAELGIVLAGVYRRKAVAFLERRAAEPEEWQRAAVLGDAILFVTAAELADLEEQVDALVGRFAPRLEHPELRPPGARAVAYIQMAFPEPGGEPADHG